MRGQLQRIQLGLLDGDLPEHALGDVGRAAGDLRRPVTQGGVEVRLWVRSGRDEADDRVAALLGELAVADGFDDLATVGRGDVVVGGVPR